MPTPEPATVARAVGYYHSLGLGNVAGGQPTLISDTIDSHGSGRRSTSQRKEGEARLMRRPQSIGRTPKKGLRCL